MKMAFNGGGKGKGGVQWRWQHSITKAMDNG